MNALIAFAFPVMAQRSSGAPFLFFACMMLVQLVVVWKVYPETKGQSLEELQERLQTAG